ncbi:MAG TPA: Vi polysaccharide biosynthesis UDP-N-acetylglucosamine C-6 dehydrogenase TviB [Saprospiraceae bacterium]|nr:Vi polysaccharide biosynthesis UDP-N-acetylglucosamine C-6 dehydrogenase TviB [Saprospiraceae bacterium]
MIADTKIGIIGLGYVGLPLAVEMAKKFDVIGFDINKKRIAELSQGMDNTLEIESEALLQVLNSNDGKGMKLTDDITALKSSNVYIVTVPTPIDKYNKPDFKPLISASETVGKVLSPGDIVVYESTVYPGATEEICIPVIEKLSGLTFNKDFYAGYSPERINPGDKEHTVSKILKIVSGSTPEVADRLEAIYNQVITAGTYKAKSIKVAEAAKVIENTQRDINIAFVNELAKIFNRLDIDTNDVLEAAGTKWNFLKFKPGLVGGHCIGVDPYYLAQKAGEVGYHPEMILAGRRLNDSMGSYVAEEVVKLMIRKDINIKNANVLVMGVTFKENCPDIRNTKVVDVVHAFQDYHTNVVVYDPWADPEEIRHEYNLISVNRIPDDMLFDAVVLAVAHDEFKSCSIRDYCKDNHVIYDIKGFLPKEMVDSRL